MVASGFEDGIYTVVNPCLVQAVDFDNDMETCTAGTLKRKKTTWTSLSEATFDIGDQTGLLNMPCIAPGVLAALH
jgi:hypothetical protein